MYTEEDINNLAEFLYLAAAQIRWSTFGESQISFKELGFIAQNNWKELAKIALEFKTNH